MWVREEGFSERVTSLGVSMKSDLPRVSLIFRVYFRQGFEMCFESFRIFITYLLEPF